LVASGTAAGLLPILASGIAIFGFFLPAIVRGGATGLEVVGPMAIAVAGGMFTTLVLALFVFPAAYARWGRVEHPDTSADELFSDYEREPERV
jgi:Cu/Ag efflux pump CusA